MHVSYTDLETKAPNSRENILLLQNVSYPLLIKAIIKEKNLFPTGICSVGGRRIGTSFSLEVSIHKRAILEAFQLLSCLQ